MALYSTKHENVSPTVDTNHSFSFIPTYGGGYLQSHSSADDNKGSVIFKKERIDDDGFVNCYPFRTVIDVRDKETLRIGDETSMYKSFRVIGIKDSTSYEGSHTYLVIASWYDNGNSLLYDVDFRANSWRDIGEKKYVLYNNAILSRVTFPYLSFVTHFNSEYHKKCCARFSPGDPLVCEKLFYDHGVEQMKVYIGSDETGVYVRCESGSYAGPSGTLTVTNNKSTTEKTTKLNIDFRKSETITFSANYGSSSAYVFNRSFNETNRPVLNHRYKFYAFMGQGGSVSAYYSFKEDVTIDENGVYHYNDYIEFYTANGTSTGCPITVTYNGSNNYSLPDFTVLGSSSPIVSREEVDVTGYDYVMVGREEVDADTSSGESATSSVFSQFRVQVLGHIEPAPEPETYDWSFSVPGTRGNEQSYTEPSGILAPGEIGTDYQYVKVTLDNTLGTVYFTPDNPISIGTMYTVYNDEDEGEYFKFSMATDGAMTVDYVSMGNPFMSSWSVDVTISNQPIT